MDTVCLAAAGGQPKAAPPDAALINGHAIAKVNQARVVQAAPPDAALINGHKASWLARCPGLMPHRPTRP